MEELQKLGLDLLKNQHFDSLAVGVINFNKSSFESFEVTTDPNQISQQIGGIFDLASLTKPLTLSFTKLLYPEIFNTDMNLLLNHRSSLPAIARLSPNDFEENINGFIIKESETNYSDLGAIRLKFEIEKVIKKDLYQCVQEIWDKEIYHWTELEDVPSCQFRATGFRSKSAILGVVNDDNAYCLKSKLPNSGLFSCVDALARTLLNANSKANLLEKMITSLNKNKRQYRFVDGWDTISNTEKTLAGKGCSLNTFGHLGFTGTSLWIDPNLGLGHIILTNATKNYWYDRNGLTKLRKEVGEYIWSNFN